MKHFAIAVAIAAALAGRGQQLSPADVAAAIEQGKAGKTLQKRCTGKADNSFDIVAEGPVGRIMRASREAARRHREFTAADVTEAMAGPWLTVTAARVEGLRTQPGERDLTHPQTEYRAQLLIKSRAPGSEEPIVLRPAAPIAYDWSNAPGHHTVKVSGPAPAGVLQRIPMPGSDMSAMFDLAAFKAIPHKDVEIYVFMTDSGGHSCRINERERLALR